MSRDYHINIFFSEEDGWIANVPDLASCSAFGATAEEALREVERARDAWLAAARDTGRPISGRPVASFIEIRSATDAKCVGTPRSSPGTRLSRRSRVVR